MYDSDDDAPPALDSLPEQVAALSARSDDTERSRATATAAVTTASAAKASSQSGVKKGFFDSKKATKKAARKKVAAPQEEEVQPLPILAGKQNNLGGSQGRGAIPQFMYLEPSEEEQQYAQMKSQMLEALKPDREAVDAMQQNPTLLSGFDDPEVMAAVEDVAKSPMNINKYKDNPKVAEFYRAMAGMAGDRLAKMGSAAAGKAS